jgi:hypothetical protein
MSGKERNPLRGNFTATAESKKHAGIPADSWLAASWRGYPESYAGYNKFAGVGFVNALDGR